MASWERMDITIKQKEYGYTATVGCKEFTFNKVEDLTKALEGYLTEPRKAAKAYLRKPEETIGKD